MSNKAINIFFFALMTFGSLSAQKELYAYAIIEPSLNAGIFTSDIVFATGQTYGNGHTPFSLGEGVSLAVQRDLSDKHGLMLNTSLSNRRIRYQTHKVAEIERYKQVLKWTTLEFGVLYVHPMIKKLHK